MKHTLIKSAGIALAVCLSGCSATRKATATRSEETVATENAEVRLTEEHRTAAATTTDEVRDLTNMLIEFTRIDLDGDSASSATRVRSITTGRVAISGDRTEKSTARSDSTATASTAATTENRLHGEYRDQTKVEEKKTAHRGVAVAIAGVCLAALVILIILKASSGTRLQRP